ncbi:hypothetical protein KKH07_00110 [Patescibacteria group bacterium]|nr:hypothetical protein [Patescibacteria group bacterium]
MSKPETKTCQNCKIKFKIEPEDFEFYKKIGVPAPTFCPECRMIRRFVWRNQRNIYKRKCDFSKKEIFSLYSSELPIKVYDSSIWNSDDWDSMDYGQDYDFNKSFLEQFNQLRREVPYSSGFVIDMVNSDYCANAGKLKNCYLVFEANYCEDSAYCVEMAYSKDCYDSSHLVKCELCYEIFLSSGCYKTFFSADCTDCQEVFFSFHCINCSNCFGCVNLRHKKYHIFNKPYSREEYFKKLEEFDIGSYQNVLSFLKRANKFHLRFPNKFIHGQKNVDVTGDDIYNSKNVLESYGIQDGEDLKYCQFVSFRPGAKNCYDYSIWGENANLIYENVSSGDGIHKLKFCFGCDADCRDFEYCIECFSSSNLFGCVGLRHKQYCILNKQYTKQSFNKLRIKIIKHMDEMPYIDKKKRVYKYGEFFPPEMSPFGYNETIVNEYFPLTKEQAIKQGYSWYNKPKAEYKATVKAKDLPDNIKDIDNKILKEVIACGNCHSRESGNPVFNNSGSPIKLGMTSCTGSGVFRIIPNELKFYQKQNLPLPRLCPDCRHQERIKQRNPLKLWHRQCMKKGCPNKFMTSYAPDRPEIVYCEECYNKEVG